MVVVVRIAGLVVQRFRGRRRDLFRNRWRGCAGRAVVQRLRGRCRMLVMAAFMFDTGLVVLGFHAGRRVVAAFMSRAGPVVSGFCTGRPVIAVP